MTGILNILAGSISSAIKDGYFNLVTLLLPGNGTNGAQNNTFLDSSSNNFTITRNGNTTQGTFSPFSQTGWSNYFDGSGDYLTAGSSSNFGMGTGTFTFECWVFPTANPTNGVGTLFDARSAATTEGYVIRIFADLKVGLFDGPASSTVYSTGTVTLNQWNHIAVVRSSTSSGGVAFYINGAASGTATVSSDLGSSWSPLIGTNRAAGFEFNGYISNLRVVKGATVYTAAFTPSTTPLTTYGSGTNALLTCQSNRFVDNSGNSLTITPTGNVSVQAFSPFAPTAAYSVATNGGSGYFDGTGDYLGCGAQTAYAFGTGTFTIEAWVYITSRSAESMIAATRASAGSAAGWSLGVGTSGGVNFYSNNFIFNSQGTVPLNAWTHVAVTREGTGTNQTKLYINGSSVATTTNSQDFTNTTLGVGAVNDGSSSLFLGYMASFRMLKGTALTSFDLTAPLTNITNTSILLNYTNAGITDATAKNDLETVGNAQISTTQSKFGGSSMYFDGTGDALPIPNNPWMRFGTGDFTIEAWIYPAVTGDRRIVSIFDDASNQFIFRLNNSTNTIAFNIITGGSSIVNFNSSSGVTLNTWTHVAAVRSGSTFTLYINGTSAGTGTSSSAFPNYTGRMWISTYDGTNEPFNGYIDDLRITRYARYTANFTAPTAAFPVQ